MPFSGTRRARDGIRVCVFAKPPVPGSVNTRLAPALGPEGAARLARAFLEDTLAALATVDWARPTLATTGPVRPHADVPEAIEEWPQGDGDLGQRVARVLARALEDAPAAIALGVDSPGLPLPLLEGARQALGRADAVIGPATDGGFYTLGLTHVDERLLDGLTWSAATTCRDTERRLRARGYSLEILPEWFDVDVPEDLPRLREEIRAGRIDAPRTARVLASMERGRPGR